MTIISRFYLRIIQVVGLIAFLTSCTTMHLNVSNLAAIPAGVPIVIGPIANHSDTPLANRQVESMITGLMQTKGFKAIRPFPRKPSCDKLIFCADETQPQQQLIAWARANHASYLLTGSVNEWRYKVGLDGEPVAGVTLLLINVNTGKTVWTSVGSIIGGSRSGLDVVGQRLLVCLLNNIVATF